jgi:hypothetical protein
VQHARGARQHWPERTVFNGGENLRNHADKRGFWPAKKACGVRPQIATGTTFTFARRKRVPLVPRPKIGHILLISLANIGNLLLVLESSSIFNWLFFNGFFRFHWNYALELMEL